MLIRPRVIPSLLIQERRLVKTKQFKKPDYLGDPVNAVKIFNEKGVDELCVMDISKRRYENGPDFELMEEIASEAFMPLAYGGGIRSIEDAKRIFQTGYEKIILNKVFASNHCLAKEIIRLFGSQSIIASVDIKKSFLGGYSVYTNSGKSLVNRNPLEWCLRMEKAGAGEILLSNIDHEGMQNGFDTAIIRQISDNVKIPVIACGGAKDTDDLLAALRNGHADAVSAGSMFVYYGEKKGILINFPSEEQLIEKGVYRYESLSDM